MSFVTPAVCTTTPAVVYGKETEVLVDLKGNRLPIFMCAPAGELADGIALFETESFLRYCYIGIPETDGRYKVFQVEDGNRYLTRRQNKGKKRFFTATQLGWEVL